MLILSFLSIYVLKIEGLYIYNLVRRNKEQKVKIERKAFLKQKTIRISVDKLRRKSGKARPYFLSVRLTEREVRQYMTMLKWYKLEFYDELTSASDRFRQLLDNFCDGIQLIEGMNEDDLKYILRRPPNWKT